MDHLMMEGEQEYHIKENSQSWFSPLGWDWTTEPLKGILLNPKW
jgi:hypothetical protein